MDAELINLDGDGFATLLAEDGTIRSDLVLDAVKREAVQCTLDAEGAVPVRVLAACAHEMILAA